MASFLYCFRYSYRSSNYCDNNSCRSFTLLKALAKSNGNLFTIAIRATTIAIAIVGRAITLERESNQKKKPRTSPKRMQKGSRVITLHGAIEKSVILLSQYWKS